MERIIKSWKQYQKTNETVAIRNNDYIISGIELPQSLINSYVKKVKDSTGTNLRHMHSDSYIAEQIVKFIVSEYSDADKLPLSILLGEDVSELESTVDADEDIEIEDQETEELEVGTEETEEVDDEFEDIDTDDEETEEDEVEDEFDEDETDEDETDEEDELPI